MADSYVSTVTSPQGERHGFGTREGLAIIFSARPDPPSARPYKDVERLKTEADQLKYSNLVSRR